MDKKSKSLPIARLEIFHSRPVVPTRRIAMGRSLLPDSPVGLNDSELSVGGLLLAAVVGRFASSIHPDIWDDLEDLIEEISRGSYIAQPRLRFRLQADKVGLAKSLHELHQDYEGKLMFKFSHTKSSPIQQILGALYAASKLTGENKNCTLNSIRLSLSWWGTDEGRFLDYILGDSSYVPTTRSKSWAISTLGLDSGALSGAEVQRHFRQKLWDIHPDRGGDPALAPELIAELAEARRVLLLEAARS